MVQLVMGGRPWLPLRQDLELIQGPLSDAGFPTWTLHDRAAHRYYRIGWLEFEILSRWPLGSAMAIADAVNRHTPMDIRPEDVERVAGFVLAHGLVTDPTPEGSRRLARIAASRRIGLWDHISRHLVFFRVTLANPDRILEATLPLARLFLNPVAAWVTVGLALTGIYLITRDLSQFGQQLQVLLTVEGALTAGLCLLGVKAVHELGHAYTAKMLGCRVPAMGVAFLLFMPLFWTDVTEAWKLKNNKDRLRIDLAGLGVELALASASTVLWAVLPPGVMRTTAYVMATTTWLVSLTVNASPFMRFDGYYVLADLLDEPNLQERSFALAMWRIRRSLFGLPDPPPETLPPGRARLMAAYALGCFVYRFFLFWSIALLIYHFFFKTLGVLMMATQIYQMMLRPLVREIGLLHSRRGEMARLATAVRLLLLVGGLTAAMTVPWRGSVAGWALLLHERQTTIYAIQPSMVAAVLVANGSPVAAGQVLIALASPDLESRIRLARLRVAVLRTKLEAMSVDSGLMREFTPTVRELESANAELAGYLHVKAELSPRAQTVGVVRDLPPWLAPGAWVAGGEVLGVVAGGPAMVEAYVPDEDLERIEVGARGKFYPESGGPVLDLVVESMDLTAVRDLNRQELSSLSGGRIPARKSETGRVVPVRTVHKVLCRIPELETPPPMSLTGKAIIAAKPVSLFALVWRNTLGVLIRESGLGR
jgi:putative peptide zinc metalloprotease protein